MKSNLKPLFAVTDEFVEYKGVSFTVNELRKLKIFLIYYGNYPNLIQTERWLVKFVIFK